MNNDNARDHVLSVEKTVLLYVTAFLHMHAILQGKKHMNATKGLLQNCSNLFAKMVNMHHLHSGLGQPKAGESTLPAAYPDLVQPLYLVLQCENVALLRSTAAAAASRLAGDLYV